MLEKAQNTDSLIAVHQIEASSLTKEINVPYYYILVFDGASSFSVDFTAYKCAGKNLLFLSPYQLLEWHHSSIGLLTSVQFHGDFYCIEYHKKEVACNGILFNNIYQQPFVSVEDDVFEEIKRIIQKIQKLSTSESDYDISVVKAYLQLILALSSKEKQQQSIPNRGSSLHTDSIIAFPTVLEEHFRETREVAFYAEKFGLTVNTFSKKVKKHYGKSPSKLIQERMVLEAKKMLHLTFKSIKEVAMALNFGDEFYFSRYFKKEVGVSPMKFRETVGISIVAK